MDFRPSKAQARLRDEVRTFLASDPACAGRAVPEDGWIAGYDPEFSRRFAERGWIGMTWPVAYGGKERSYLDRLIVTEELLLAAAPVATEAARIVNMRPSSRAFWTTITTACSVPMNVTTDNSGPS